MEITNFNVLLAVLILVPVVFGVVAYFSPWDKLRSLSIVLCSVIVAAAGILITIEPNGQFTLPGSEMIATILEVGIVAVILFIAVKIKNWLIILMSLVQMGVIIAEIILANTGHTVAHTHDFATDPLTKILILITSIVGPIIAVYAIGYMKSHQEHAPPKSGLATHVTVEVPQINFAVQVLQRFFRAVEPPVTGAITPTLIVAFEE